MTARDYSNSQNLVISFEYSWFLAKILSNFVSLPWKLHNRECHIGHFITYFLIFTVEFINPDSMGTMRLFLHQHLIVESIKRIMTTFTFDALRAATVLTMYNNAALSLWKKMGLECFWSRTPGPWLVCFFRSGKIPHEPNPQHLSH